MAALQRSASKLQQIKAECLDHKFTTSTLPQLNHKLLLLKKRSNSLKAFWNGDIVYIRYIDIDIYIWESLSMLLYSRTKHISNSLL